MLQSLRIWASYHQEFAVEPTRQKNSSPKKSNESSWALASEGMQLAVTLLVFVFVGFALDKKKGTSPWFTLVGAVVGIVVGLYGFLRKFIKKS